MHKLNPWKLTDGFFAVSERDKKLLYVFITPLLIPVFAMVYSIPFLLLVTFIVIPFSDTVNTHLATFFTIVIVACFILACITVVRMWLCQKKDPSE